MKKKHFYEVMKGVAVTVSPLLLSFLIALLAAAVLLPSLAPYLSSLSLVMQKEENVGKEDSYQNLFEGYEPSTQEENQTDGGEWIDGNDIVYPKRGDLYAKLTVEAIGLETNVYFDDTDAALSRGGVGQSYSTRPAGYGSPVLISGHNNGKFNALQHLKVGDEITITTNYGIFKYRVRECAVKHKDDPEAVDIYQEVEELILYTCYPFTMLGLTSQRYFVYADKIAGPTVKR